MLRMSGQLKEALEFAANAPPGKMTPTGDVLWRGQSSSELAPQRVPALAVRTPRCGRRDAIQGRLCQRSVLPRPTFAITSSRFRRRIFSAG